MPKEHRTVASPDSSAVWLYLAILECEGNRAGKWQAGSKHPNIKAASKPCHPFYQRLRVKGNRHSCTSWNKSKTWETELQKKSWRTETESHATPAPNSQPFSVPFPLLSSTTFLSGQERGVLWRTRDFRHRSHKRQRACFFFLCDKSIPLPFQPPPRRPSAASPEWNPSLPPGRVEHSLRAAAPLRFFR